MARRKTWREKLATGEPHVTRLEKPFAGLPAGTRLLISSPQEVQAYVRAIPRGETRSILTLRAELAARHGADAACPTSTSIFLRIVAEAALEEMAEGRGPAEVAPFWRVVDPRSSLARKLPCDPQLIETLRAAETAS